MEIQDSGSSELNKSFMYTQLLKEILLDMKRDYKRKNALVKFCRIKYADNECQLGLIDDFKLECNDQIVVEWYTKESFLFSMMNRALRSQDIETIMKMGFIICDFHQQISKNV
ncbi:unnamed protein product [Rotaria sp. Silwood1]|nr:unnamed protein product [Rotaria sp. Silwood1]CAF1152375.1 unnamed protein product [Rotaria sp. Silwood1]CAF3471880.1 unnamed protein product [Rotaria sp. Silwood1]CAF4746311.1 unnamed protein product [Rotaria sp. Silwood1]